MALSFRKVFSARFWMALITTVLACAIVAFLVFKATPETQEKLALVIVSSFMSTWAVIITFYFTRADRKPGEPDA